MQKVVLKPGDVIPDKAVFDSASVNGDGELVGISVYMPEQKPKHSEPPDRIIFLRDGEQVGDSADATHCMSFSYVPLNKLATGDKPTRDEEQHDRT